MKKRTIDDLNKGIASLVIYESHIYDKDELRHGKLLYSGSACNNVEFSKLTAEKYRKNRLIKSELTNTNSKLFTKIIREYHGIDWELARKLAEQSTELHKGYLTIDHFDDQIYNKEVEVS